MDHVKDDVSTVMANLLIKLGLIKTGQLPQHGEIVLKIQHGSVFSVNLDQSVRLSN